MVSCQSRNAVLALRADFTLLVIAGLDPAIQLFLKDGCPGQARA
jgi:hypothetical protein